MKEKDYAMVLVPGRCIDCKGCTVACKAQNKVPLGKEYFRTQILEGEKIENGQVTAIDFMPLLCFHCENAPCISVCPTSASYHNEDGMVLIDKERCIGCRMCVLACPYNARYYNEHEGIVDKCTFCVERLKAGMKPACVSTCPTEARVFGDLNDKNSEVYKLLHQKAKKVWQPKANMLGVKPLVYYVEV
ncbi:MAG: 4Fe-4S dicluster domain-containing protein [Deltaproteobacteria bacterium]|nr:4Fe-4S dicluster domain-containing protein [Deltaproteobacteria bacterium]